MSGAKGRAMRASLRDWLEGQSREDWEMIARQIAEHIIERAIGGDFGYIKLLLDLTEGRVVQRAEDTMVFADGCTLIVADDGRDSEMVRAA